MDRDTEMQLCLKWNNFACTMTSAFHSLHVGGELVDVTLAAEGQQIQAHRLVLAACSPYFREILKRNPCDHPVIILREVSASELQRILLFMYQGQVNVPHSSLPDFLRLADVLKIRGLTDSSTCIQAHQDYSQSNSTNSNANISSTSALHCASPSPNSLINASSAWPCSLEKESVRQITCPSDHGSNKRKRISSPAASPPQPHTSSPAPASSPPLYTTALQQSHPPLPHTPELKAEIQDMLEVKLESGDSPEAVVCEGGGGACLGVVSPTSPSTSAALLPACTAPLSCLPPTTGEVEASCTTSSTSALYILPKSHAMEHTNSQICLKSTASLQPEFPLDPSYNNLPYPCPFCDKAYMSWGFRRRHIKGCHTSSPELPCKWCRTVLPSHTHWEDHVQLQHQLSLNAARNGLLILEEAHMVLQFAAPTRIHSLMELIKDKKSSSVSIAPTPSTAAANTITTTTPPLTKSGEATTAACVAGEISRDASPSLTDCTTSTSATTHTTSTTTTSTCVTTRRQRVEAARQQDEQLPEQ